VKEPSNLILAILYLYFTIGAKVNQHYCMGELVGASLFDLKSKECGKCGMKKHSEASKDCCKDVSIVVKTGDSHTFSQTVYDFNFLSIIPNAPSILWGTKIFKEEDAKLYRAHSPPLLKYPLFLKYQNFRI